MGHVRVRINKRQAKELIQQFESDSDFNFHKSNDGEFYTVLPRQGGSVIHIFKSDKYYYLEIFS